MKQSEKLEPFEKNMRVRLSDQVLHPEFRGLTGVVERTIKFRGVVVVRLDSGKRYDALPENVIREAA